MTVTAFADADNPHMLRPFLARFNIARAYMRPIGLRCAQCDTVMKLVMAADRGIDDHDTKIFLVFEALGRGWDCSGSGRPYCPKCRKVS